MPDDLTAPVDEGDLAEILGNLIENASRFARTSVRIAAHKTTEGTTLSVIDDGPGIPDADREAVLTRGVRLDGNRSGTGLGLAIVSDIVGAYGGRLALSDVGPGLAVTLFLPKEAPSPA
jgi:signal transduction histidine kinase